MSDASGEGTRLILWRHGQTAENLAQVHQGQLDTDLNAVGLHQAHAAAAVLADRAPNRIVSSDLTRAARTADALSRQCGVEVSFDPRLREIDVGRWSGLSHDEVARRYPAEVQAIACGGDVRRGEHGETVTEVGHRTRAAALAAVAQAATAELVVLVTHGVAARAMGGALVGQDWQSKTPLGNCHWAELVHTDAGWVLDTWNCGP